MCKQGQCIYKSSSAGGDYCIDKQRMCDSFIDAKPVYEEQNVRIENIDTSGETFISLRDKAVERHEQMSGSCYKCGHTICVCDNKEKEFYEEIKCEVEFYGDMCEVGCNYLNDSMSLCDLFIEELDLLERCDECKKYF